MKIYIPIIGLKKRYNLEDIQLLEILNIDSPGKSVLPPLSNISQKAINLLGLIDNIFLIREKKELHAIYKFTDLNNPEIFQGQEDIESMGLGLIIKIYEMIFFKKYKSKFDISCITGIIKKFPDKEQILSGNFINDNTGMIKEKFNTFIEYIKRNNLHNKKSIFLYSGEIEENNLRKIILKENLNNIYIKKEKNFNRLIDYLFIKQKVKSLIAVFSLILTPFIILGIILSCLFFYNNYKINLINNKNLLTNEIKIKTEGNFLKYYSYNKENHLLALPSCKGNIDIFISEINIKKFPYLSFNIRNNSETNEFYIELKNKNNQLFTNDKIKIIIPSTENKFENCSFYLYDLETKPIENINIITFLNPKEPIEINEIKFSTLKPVESSLLLQFGENELIKRNDFNLISLAYFRGGGGIDFRQDKTLKVESSSGWIWTVIPEIDIKNHPILYIKAKTSYNIYIYIELKYTENLKELPIIADENNLDRMRLMIPDTKGKFKLFPIELKIKPEMQDKTIAHVMALSGPTGKIEISEMYFK